MNEVNLSGIDLNLLLVVDVVLQERSATRAAARLHITQSAVSNALGRARAVFGDPLVVRNGRGFALTPRGSRLAPRLRAILEDVRGIVGDDPAFQPATTTRRFTIACADAVGFVLLPALLARFEARLPRAQLCAVTLDSLIAAGGLERADVDLLIGVPPTVPPGCQSQDVFEDPLVAIVRADHPAVGRRLSLKTYARLPHAELALFGEPEDRVDRALASHGLQRRIQVTTPHVVALPSLVAGSDRVATSIASVARCLAGVLGLRILKPPVTLAPLVVKQVWHHRASDDPGNRLLRDLVRDAARSVGSRRSTGFAG